MPQSDRPATEGLRRFGWLNRIWVQHVGAFGVFLGAWLAAMGPRILPHLGDRVLSTIPQESSLFVWSLAWWPHALAHAANPLLCPVAWAPTGLNLAWVTTAPGPSIVAAPLTIAAGPVVSFNVLTLLIPPITAWAAYLLSRYVSHSFLAGLVGGALFGFSPVVIREVVQGHTNIALLFPIPLALYLVIRRMDGSIGRRRFVLLLTAVLLGEFLIFTEIFATMGVVGALVAIAAVLLAPKNMRSRVIDTTLLVGLSFVLAALVVAPYLVTAFAYPEAVKPPGFRGLGLSLRGLWDFRRFVVPGPGFLVGAHPGGDLASLNFWYFGVPLLVILGAAWAANRRSYAARVLAAGFLISIVLSLGRAIPIGHTLVPLPWAPLGHLPLLNRARPHRIVAFAFLLASVSVAWWLAQARGLRDRAVRWAMVGVAGAFLVPNVVTGSWTSSARVPQFFATQQYRRSLCQNEIVLVVAAGPKQVLWQAQTGMYFRTIGWYPGFRPESYRDVPTALRLQKGLISPDDGPAVRRFLADHQVTAILLGGGQVYAGQQLRSLLGVEPQPLGGITLMRVAPCSPSGSSA